MSDSEDEENQNIELNEFNGEQDFVDGPASPSNRDSVVRNSHQNSLCENFISNFRSLLMALDLRTFFLEDIFENVTVARERVR